MKRSGSQIVTTTFIPSKKSKTRKRSIKYPKEGIPQVSHAKLRYACEVTITPPGSSGISYHQFGANCLYDPDITGVGHQPMGFDQWMALYGVYVVNKAKIDVQWMPQSSGNAKPAYFGICSTDNISELSGTTVMGAIEQRDGTSTPGTYGSLNDLASGATHRRYAYDLKKDKGVSLYGGINTLQQGTNATNPADRHFFAVWAGGSNGDIGPPTGVFKVTIDYDVEFSGPLVLGQS